MTVAREGNENQTNWFDIIIIIVLFYADNIYSFVEAFGTRTEEQVRATRTINNVHICYMTDFSGQRAIWVYIYNAFYVLIYGVVVH